MNEQTVRVTLEYVGGFTATNAHEYRITKIVGAPNVNVVQPGGERGDMKVARVGDLIDEAQAVALASITEVTTVPQKP